MAATQGINHIGLAVRDLSATTSFFVEALGWEESGHDPSYPRRAVSDGVVRLTLWQVDHAQQVNGFDRRVNVGLHHLALEVESEDRLFEVAEKVSGHSGVKLEFAPEFVGSGPRKHMMCFEPGGIRIEFIWPGA